VIKLLNAKFVCFAPGWGVNTDDKIYYETWQRFYHAKPLPGEGKGWLTGSQLVLMTSAGRLLSGAIKYGDKNGLGPALQEVLTAYAKLPEAERRPETVAGEAKPTPAPPPGGLVLTIYDRPLGRTADGGMRLPEGKDLGGLRPHASHGQRSSLWLTADEWQSLLPKDLQKGQTYPVPAKMARRLLLFGLWPHSLWVVTHQWQPDALQAGKLQLTVEEVSKTVLRLRLHGAVLLASKAGHIQYPTGKILKQVDNRYDGTVEGVLIYNRVKQQFTTWDMAAVGDYTGTWFAGNDGWKEATAEAPVAMGFAFALDRSDYEVAPEFRRPRSFIHSYIFQGREEFYWDPEEWETDWKKKQPK
jgi:hypothetical protein